MIGLWRSHSDYQKFLIEQLLPVYLSDKKRVSQYASILTKLYSLDLDRIKSLVSEVYSYTGAPAKFQPEILRSFILMSHLDEPSISNWVAKLKADSLLALMIGVAHDAVPEFGNHYDLMNRLWLANPDSTDQDSLHPFRRKPRKKLAKNQKLPPRHPGIIQKFVDLALQDKSFEHRPERLLQQIFAEVAVKPSAEQGLLGNTGALVIAGDGTCINTGASPYGVKLCSCTSKGIYNCECPRRYSDPRARWGWDSYHETWFFGYTWRVMIHSINIHLNAMLKVCGFKFLELLDQRLSLAA